MGARIFRGSSDSRISLFVIILLIGPFGISGSTINRGSLADNIQTGINIAGKMFGKIVFFVF